MELSNVKDRVIVKVWMEEKNWHTFNDGTKIRLERKYDNFNRRYTEAVQGIVISAEHIPTGAIVLFHHNSVHDVNRLFNYGQISGNDIASDIRYYSVPIEECYLYKNGDEWEPCYGFETALRIFKPYEGVLDNIPPTLIKNKLWITSGEFKDKVALTLRACDYEIIFQDNGKENRIIRVRHFEGEDLNDREELIAIDNYATEKVLNGELLIGLSASDAAKFKNFEYAS